MAQQYDPRATYALTDAIDGEEIFTGLGEEVEAALLEEFDDLIALHRDDIYRAVTDWYNNEEILALRIERVA